MLKINTNRNTWRVPTHWEDVNLSQCVELYNIVQVAREDIKQHFVAYATGGEVADVKAEDLLSFIRAALVAISDADDKTLERVSDNDLMALSSAILPRFVCGVMGMVDYAPLSKEYFRWHGRRFFLPSTGSDVMGCPTPLSHLSAVELCQLSDIIMSDNIALAPLAVAICCRPRREEYDEVKAQRRAIRFAKLPSSIFWELWHRVSETHKYLRKCFPDCYGKESGGERGSGRKSVLWGDMMVSMAAGRPSELTTLERMNGYTFVRLMNEQIKLKAEEWKMRAALSGLGGM